LDLHHLGNILISYHKNGDLIYWDLSNMRQGYRKQVEKDFKEIHFIENSDKYFLYHNSKVFLIIF